MPTHHPINSVALTSVSKCAVCKSVTRTFLHNIILSILPCGESLKYPTCMTACMWLKEKGSPDGTASGWTVHILALSSYWVPHWANHKIAPPPTPLFGLGFRKIIRIWMLVYQYATYYIRDQLKKNMVKAPGFAASPTFSLGRRCL